MRFGYEPNQIIVDSEDKVEVITAVSPADFVDQLWQTSYGTGTVDEYLAHYAKWNQEFDGIALRTDTPDNFVEDLLKNGYLKITDNRYELHTQPQSV